MLNLNSYICVLDIGSSKIAAAVVGFKRKRIANIFFDSIISKGIKGGVIIDSIEVVGSISKLIKNLKAKSGINIKALSTNISGEHIVTKHSRAIMPLAERGNKVIAVSDIRNVNDQARILGSSLEEDIIKIIPSAYTIDSKSNIINPIGLYSHKLEVDLYLVCAKLSSVQSLSRAINQSGYEMRNLFFSGLATSKAVFNKELNEGINLFCDIGKDTTELLIFNSGILKDIKILPMGGDNLTLQLQDALKIPFELAEDIKRSYGIIGDPEQLGEEREILVKKTNLYKPIKQKYVSEIITSSAKLICSNIKEAIEKKIPNYQINNLIVVGRAALLEGLIETLEGTMSIPVRLGRLINPDIPSSIKEHNDLSGQKYLTYLTCLGMIGEELQNKSTLRLPTGKPAKNPIARAINKFKEAYQEYF